MSHYSKSGSRGKKEQRNGYIPKKPGDMIQMDAVERWIDRFKRYIIMAIDLRPKFNFAMCYNMNAGDFLECFQEVYLSGTRCIQMDNGSELEKFCDRTS